MESAEKQPGRTFTLNSSIVLRDAYRYYKKYKPSKAKFTLTEGQFGSIIKEVNLKLVEKFLEGHPIKFPHQMGMIQLQKREVTARFKDGKFISTAAINWPATKQMWEDYPESKEQKKLVRHTNQFVYKIAYLKRQAIFINKSVVGFRPQRSFKKLVSDLILEGKLDGYMNKLLIYGKEIY